MALYLIFGFLRVLFCVFVPFCHIFLLDYPIIVVLVCGTHILWTNSSPLASLSPSFPLQKWQCQFPGAILTRFWICHFLSPRGLNRPRLKPQQGFKPGTDWFSRSLISRHNLFPQFPELQSITIPTLGSFMSRFYRLAGQSLGAKLAGIISRPGGSSSIQHRFPKFKFAG